MRLTSVFGFVQTAATLASGQSKAKGEYILVQCHSVATGYQVNKIRPRLDEKAEFVSWDPLVQREVLYREHKKIKTVKPSRQDYTKSRYEWASCLHRLGTDPLKKPERIYSYLPRNYYFDYDTLKVKDPPKDWAAAKVKKKRSHFNYTVLQKDVEYNKF